MKSSWALLALAVVFLSSPARADDKTPSVGTIGTGTFSCAKFGKYDGQPASSAQMGLIVQWAWGFISAYNARAAFAPTFQEEDAPNPIRPPDAPTLLTYIHKYCQVKPESNVTNAILDLISASGGIVTSSISF
jgi:hypothetical protein